MTAKLSLYSANLINDSIIAPMDFQKLPFNADEFRRFQLGEESSFRVIYDFYQPLLLQKIVFFSKDLIEAEDITQEIFVQLFLKRSEIKSPEVIFPFLYTVAKRAAISSFRKQLTRRRYQEEELVSLEDGVSSTQDAIYYTELQGNMDAVLAELPAQQKLIYQKNKLEDKSYEEIAELTGLSKNTVRNHLHLANKFVRLRLSKLLFLLFLLNF